MLDREPDSNRGSVRGSIGKNSEYTDPDQLELQAKTKTRKVANQKLRGTEGLKDLNEGLQPNAE